MSLVMAKPTRSDGASRLGRAPLAHEQDEVIDELAPLVERSRQGDVEAFDVLVHKTESYVYNLAYHILGNPQEAEDMTQEVFVRAWRALGSFRAESRFTTWLYRITINVCLNRKRRLRTELQVVGGETVWDDMAAPEERADPSVAMADRDIATSLWGAVDRLSAKYRLVIVLFYQEEFSYDEIAEMLALPLGTIKSHLHRARRALAALLSQRKEAHHVSL